MSDHKLKSYLRIHKYSQPSDIEKGKIKKEINNYLKYTKKSNQLTKKMIRNLNYYNTEDENDEFIDESITEANLIAESENGNAKTHKNRLKQLNKYEEFD
ncbi:hypothetical protein C162_02802 [Paenibacillus sp. FSL R7-269]|uniref:hypothetical protein n=1 Tax=Paenibacillus sp. FSL R7-269 TaxID=1226755 RepID=UPI0003E26553|nr:hypothetical protein [Paenibacillus sp. FSL R7-269]ETT55665.1 hypothetical protein C162_02802 [Paenibacillus sp. FSL R7-269]